MVKNKILVICFLMILISFSSVFSQKKIKFKEVRKELLANQYETGIPLALDFIKQNPTHFRAHYLLAIVYDDRAEEITKQQNALIEQNPTGKDWTEKEYEEDLNLWKKIIAFQDSAIYFYKKSSSLITDGFLSKNIGICESGFGTCYEEFYKNNTLETARQYIKEQIEGFQKSLNLNKVTFQNVQKKYEDVKNKYLISSDKIGVFQKNMSVKDLKAGPYQRITYKEEEGEGDNYYIFSVFDGGVKILEMISWDKEVISDFTILSKKFKTKEGFGIGDTYKDLKDKVGQPAKPEIGFNESLIGGNVYVKVPSFSKDMLFIFDLNSLPNKNIPDCWDRHCYYDGNIPDNAVIDKIVY